MPVRFVSEQLGWGVDWNQDSYTVNIKNKKEKIVMQNIPKVKIGIVAVSRDCFPESLSVNRRKALVKAYSDKYDTDDIYECPICIVESEIHMKEALEDIKKAGCNALCVYLGNFGPEISETMLAQQFNGPKMFVAAAEENIGTLSDDRGDAYCGMLNASYNLKLRGVRAYIPEYPVGTAEECADMINEFVPIARAVIGLSDLKIISFGPRPLNFLACNAPIYQLYQLGVEIEENSELDLFESFNAHDGDLRIASVVTDMEKELGDGNKKPEILAKLAQYELTLLDWIESHKGSKKYVAIAGKCWPAFQTQFGFVPCYVNSRLTGRGIPVSCEVDIYGALSEYIGTCVSEDAVTLLDINNSVPADMFKQDIDGKFNYTNKDTFMGFHCGNTCSSKLAAYSMKYQKIMARSLPVEVTMVHLKVILFRAISLSSDCSQPLMQSFEATLQTVRFCLLQHTHLVRLVYLLFLKWDVSTVMFLLKRIIRIMVRLHSDIMVKRCLKCLNTLVFR